MTAPISAGRLVAAVPEPARRVWGWLTGGEFFASTGTLAFYGLISIPPMTIIALWLAGLVLGPDELRSTTEQLVEQAPDEFRLGDLVNGFTAAAGSMGWVSVLAALWPATAYGAALAKAFTLVSGPQQRQVQGWKGRLLALAVVGLLPLVVFAGVALVYVVPQLVGADGPGLQLLLGTAALSAFFLVVLVVFALYQVRDQSFRNLVLGAALATALQAGLTAGYVAWLTVGGASEKTYGTTSLAVVVTLGLYLLLSNGALLSAYRYALHRSRRGSPSR